MPLWRSDGLLLSVGVVRNPEGWKLPRSPNNGRKAEVPGVPEDLGKRHAEQQGEKMVISTRARAGFHTPCPAQVPYMRWVPQILLLAMAGSVQGLQARGTDHIIR